MKNFGISATKMAAGLVGWLTACFILADRSRLTVVLVPSVIMPSLLCTGLAWV